MAKRGTDDGGASPPLSRQAKRLAESGLDRRWHLAQTPDEIAVTEFEYALIRAGEGFSHWQAECLAAVTGLAMSGADNAILHVIRMKDRPKGVKEIGRLMNRDDIPNIQYSIRKLLKAGLIEKLGESSRRKGVAYQATKKGVKVTEDYAKLRANLLIDFFRDMGGVDDNLETATRVLELVAGIYEQTGRIAATYRKDRRDD
ncbi:MAG: hypothetical protein Tsb0010_03870 [Parvularculaceae bacterium]